MRGGALGGPSAILVGDRNCSNFSHLSTAKGFQLTELWEL